MTVTCAISGTVPQEAVVATPCGFVFEKKLILKHLEDSEECPVSGTKLTAADLVDLKQNKAVPPRPASASSVPGLLHLFQEEWDATMNETFQLKMQLETVRQQLAHSLYQHDAACRVIARLIRERDGLRAQIAPMQHQLAQARAGQAAGGAAQDMDVEEGITQDMVNRMTSHSQTLCGDRKGLVKRLAAEVTPVDTVQQYKEVQSQPIHQSTAPGILCVDVHAEDDSRICTGGVDQHVNIFDKSAKKLVASLNGHQKKVSSVQMHPKKNVVVSTSYDGTARIWSCKDDDWKGKWSSAGVIRCHTDTVTSATIHPLGDFFVASSLDKTWSFNDLHSGRSIQKVEGGVGYNGMYFHPDGLILAGCGTDSIVTIWDIKGQTKAAELSGHTGEVTSLSFSQNGYYLASGGKDGVVKLWDLRKPINFTTIQPEDNAPISCVRFDKSGQYIAFTNSAVNVYNFKGRTNVEETTTFSNHSGPVTGCAWGDKAGYLATTSMDRTLKIFGN